VFTRSPITPLKMNRLGWNLEHSEYIVGGWPWHMLGAIRPVATAWEPGEIFCKVSNARFHRFSVGHISRNLNTTRRSVSQWKLSGTQFWKFCRKWSFFQKCKILSKIFNVLRLQAAITPQWLQIAGSLLPKLTLYGICSFHFSRWNDFKVIPWPIRFIQETSPNFLRRPMRVDNMADNAGITLSQTPNHHRLLSQRH